MSEDEDTREGEESPVVSESVTHYRVAVWFMAATGPMGSTITHSAYEDIGTYDDEDEARKEYERLRNSPGALMWEFSEVINRVIDRGERPVPTT